LPSKHNKLEVTIVEEFSPRFAPDAKPIYIRDTKQKTLILDKAALTKLGIPVAGSSKIRGPNCMGYRSLDRGNAFTHDSFEWG
jgi:hypothetical protein